MKIPRQAKRNARQLFRLCLVDSLFDDNRAERLVQRIIQEKPRGYRAALAYFQRLVKLDYARRTANIESAVPLPAEMSSGLQTRITRAYGPGVNFSFEQNPALIGGMRITVGSDVYDGSVQARLNALGKSL